MTFVLSFLLNLSVTPLPAEELNVRTLCCVSYLILSPARLRSERKFMSNFISKVLSCVSSREGRY